MEWVVVVVAVALAVALLGLLLRAARREAARAPSSSKAKPAPVPPASAAPATEVLPRAAAPALPPLAVKAVKNALTSCAFGADGLLAVCDGRTLKLLGAGRKAVATLLLTPAALERVQWAGPSALVGHDGYTNEVLTVAWTQRELRIKGRVKVDANVRALAAARGLLAVLSESALALVDLRTDAEVYRVGAEKFRNNDVALCESADGTTVTVVLATWSAEATTLVCTHQAGAWTVVRGPLLPGAGDELVRCAGGRNAAVTAARDGRVCFHSLAPLVKWRVSGLRFAPSALAVGPGGTTVALARGQDVLLVARDGSVSLHEAVVGGPVVALSWSATGDELALAVQGACEVFVWTVPSA